MKLEIGKRLLRGVGDRCIMLIFTIKETRNYVLTDEIRKFFETILYHRYKNLLDYIYIYLFLYCCVPRHDKVRVGRTNPVEVSTW